MRQADLERMQIVHHITGKNWAATVEWYPAPGITQCATAVGDGRADAVARAWDSALKTGYTPPKWWQYWRWKENRR